MAARFGGKFSPGEKAPDGAGPVARTRRGRAGARVNILFLVPLLFGGRAFSQDPVGLALDLGACAVLLLAAWMTREGLLAQEAYDARKVARRPVIPRKIFGSVLIGAGLALGGIGDGVVAAGIFAVLGAGLHFAAFGPDPLRDKGADGIDRFQTDRVARAVEEAEKHLAAMMDAVRGTGDRALVDRVAAFQATVRAMFRTVENDPRDLAAARRYLGVYLLGARDAAVKFADLAATRQDAAAREKFVVLLGDLESNFAARTKSLLANDRDDLDIEIGVLRDRLAREGLRDV